METFFYGVVLGFLFFIRCGSRRLTHVADLYVLLVIRRSKWIKKH